MINKMKGTLIFVFLFILLIGIVSFVQGQETSATVCCERTNTGAWCQNVPADECDAGYRSVPTSCDTTSYCAAGTCYDSNEGTCLDNTPQLVCNENGGVWSEERPPQCELGCCILGDQAAFVSLVRCKKLSSHLGLETNYDSSIGNELECIAAVQTQEKGACVYEFEFEKTCRFVTRGECEGSSESGNGSISDGTFYPGKLCSAEELGTTCGPTTKTTCVPGKDEVYFVDSCGNPANIYDSSKTKDKEYWTNVKSSSESCGFGTGNILSSSCGNCDYLRGSYCRDENVAGGNPTYGDYICADLNCRNTQDGNNYRHGESWCVFDDEGSTGGGENSVGSRFFKHICINGEEVLEQCADFRAEECIETELGDSSFSQAACRVNRWQDCTAQDEKEDCENTDVRDCYWTDDVEFPVASDEEGEIQEGICLPRNPPGLKFWEGADAEGICAQGNIVCVVKFEEGIFGGEECVENCECLTENWEKERSDVCRSLGDCGPGINWVGEKGYKEGFKVEVGDYEG